MQPTPFHDAEIERINALELSEEERQDQLEDNQLARERGIHRLTELDNTFTETRLANERAVQEEIERTNAMRARAAERAEAEAQREAERQARASERAEAEAQRQADREQSAGIGLLRTDVQRAQFDLGLATDEDDFEARRQAALDATNAFHDAEAERIDGLMLSETQLANQRAANALARERAIHRLTTAENTFETQRIRAAERAEAEAQREAERQARASERAEAEAQREAERQAQAEQRAQERAEREAERQTEAEQREQERAEAEAQRQADREQSAGIGLLRTDVQRAQFGLGLATDESDFEARRQAALDATNAFHDAEAERIDGLMLSETQLANQRAANALARERAIHRLTTAENTFETQRLRDAEEAARAAERANEEAARLAEREAREAERVEAERIRAAERAERERTRLIEREQRERQRIAERQQREAERANEQRIREEMRTQDRIDDLRDDAFENEQDRQQRLLDLEQDTQDRITDIHRQAMRNREDIELDSDRDFMDVLREAGVDESLFTSGAFPEIQRLAGVADPRFLREALAGAGVSVSDDAFQELRGLGRTRRRALIDASTREGRQITDATQAAERREAEINATAAAQAQALTTALTPLLTQQQTTAEKEAITAETTAQTAMTEATTAMTASETAVTEAGTALVQSAAVDNFATAADAFLEGAIAFRDGVMLAGAGPTPEMVQNMVINAQNVIVNGANFGSGGGTSDMTVVVQPQDVVLDNQKVGQVVGNTIVQQGANRRNLLGRDD